MSFELVNHTNTFPEIYFKTKGKIVMCLDKSGSMSFHAPEVVVAYNKFVDKLKTDPRVMYDFSLWSFANQSKVEITDKPIEEINPLTYEAYAFDTEGGTALYDAIKDAILSLNGVGPNTKVVVVVISDGEENNSKFTSAEEVLGLVEALSKLPNWTFLYLGIGEHCEEAVELGFKPGNTADIEASDLDAVLQKLADKIQGLCLCLDSVDKETLLLE